MSNKLRFESYKPNDRQKVFHQIPRWKGRGKLVKGAMGGLGGGKSAACMQELGITALSTPGGVSIAGRQSMPKAFTLIDDMGEFFGPIAEWKKGSYWFPNGHEVKVAPFDKWDRQGSTKFVVAYAQEAQELEPRSLFVLSERLRHPAGVVNGVPWYRLLFDARPIETMHWLNERFVKYAWNVEDGPAAREKARLPHWIYVRFQTYDNLQNLRPGYVEELEAEYGEDPRFLRMMLYGEIGYTLEGTPVFGDAYNPEIHDAKIEEDHRLPILRSWDFGYHYPALTWNQFTRQGSLLTLREFTPHDIALDRFIDEVKAIQRTEFPNRHGSQYRDFGDIAGDQTDWTGQKPHDIVSAAFDTYFEGLQKARVEDGINIVRKLMRTPARSVDGRLRTKYLVDVSCETLREALRGGYRYPDKGNTEKPKKGTPYDGVADTVRYVAQSVVGETQSDSEYEWRGATTVRDFASYGPHG